jgi:hypothetical protein
MKEFASDSLIYSYNYKCLTKFSCCVEILTNFHQSFFNFNKHNTATVTIKNSKSKLAAL